MAVAVDDGAASDWMRCILVVHQSKNDYESEQKKTSLEHRPTLTLEIAFLPMKCEKNQLNSTECSTHCIFRVKERIEETHASTTFGSVVAQLK